MRDLANQSILRRRRISARSSRFFLTVAIVIVAIWAVAWKLNGQSTSLGGEAAYLKDAPKGLTPVKVSGAAVDADLGINLSSGTAKLGDVKYGGSASGSATRTYGDGSYSLSVTATLPDPKGGDKYQVWLYDGSVPFDAGFMSGSKNSWSLVFRDKDKYSSYETVWVTREITTEDGKPETKILAGSF